jgi:hypothetical protein
MMQVKGEAASVISDATRYDGLTTECGAEQLQETSVRDKFGLRLSFFGWPRKNTGLMPSSQRTVAAPEGGPMAMFIFVLLNGVGVAFLLYVLVNFWKEGKRANYPGARSCGHLCMESTKPEVFVATHPLAVEPDRPNKHAVIRFHALEDRVREKQVARNPVEGAEKISIRRFPLK